MNSLQHNGFLAEIDIDAERGLLRGIVVNAHKPLKFEGNTVSELKTAFARAVADFQDQSEASGLEGKPARPISAEQHARMVKRSSLRGRHRPGGALDYWTLQEAYDELLAGLCLAHHEFVGADDNGIKGAKLACQKTAWFINCRWENPELASPFLTLFKALEDGQRGRKPGLFFPERHVEKRPRTLLAKHVKTFVAALHEVDIELGASAKESAARIALAVRKWPTLKTAQVRRITVKYWRDSARGSSKTERVQFEGIVSGLLKERDPKQKLEDFLRDGPPGLPRPPKKKKLEI